MTVKFKKIQDLRVAIVGLGYAGLPLAVEFGKIRGVLGFDLSSKRVSELNVFFDRTNELTREELLEAKQLVVTDDPTLLKTCNFYIITVPTPVDFNNKPDFSILENASELVGSMLDGGDVVVFESTVYPGATEEICAPILERVSGLKYSQKTVLEESSVFYLGYSPERINPGDKEHKLKDIIKITSGSTEEVANLVDALYATIILAGTYLAENIRIAEAAKVIENVQRDVNIALVNELAMIFDSLDLDTTKILEAAKSKWNFLPFTPGLVGGHCVGVDPYYLIEKSIEAGHEPTLILAGRRVNDDTCLFVARKIIKIMNKKKIKVVGAKILILGAAFKENCSDVRNSKIVTLAKFFQKQKCHVHVFDPKVDNFDESSELKKIATKNPKKNNYDAVILGVNHDIFIKQGHLKIKKYGKENHVFFDLKSAFSEADSDGRL